VLKKFISIILLFFMTFMPCAYATDTLQGSVSVDIVPYCQNWTSVQAFNEINRIGTKLKLANNINEEIVFNVSEKDEANATTNINNQIDVYQGLLQYVETEDELAFVIGHEMGHVTKTHVKKTIVRNTIISAAGVAGSALSAIGLAGNSTKMVKSGAILVGSSAVGALAGKKVSRSQETSSDLASIDYMVNAGYNPLATISILNKISGNYFDLLSDHPSGEKRIKKAYQYISKNYPQYIDEGYNSTSYQRALSIINKEK
jgi:predicted Zn-dependent protease